MSRSKAKKSTPNVRRTKTIKRLGKNSLVKLGDNVPLDIKREGELAKVRYILANSSGWASKLAPGHYKLVTNTGYTLVLDRLILQSGPSIISLTDRESRSLIISFNKKIKANY
jgi:hypothetical protein